MGINIHKRPENPKHFTVREMKKAKIYFEGNLVDVIEFEFLIADTANNLWVAKQGDKLIGSIPFNYLIIRE